MNTLKDTIYELEKSLMTPEARRSAQVIRVRLCDDFTEFCSSGRVYHYQTGDVFDDGSAEYRYEIEDFALDQMSEDSVHVTYTAIKHSGGSIVRSLRSSLWRKQDDEWKLWFHQGTQVFEEITLI